MTRFKIIWNILTCRWNNIDDVLRHSAEKISMQNEFPMDTIDYRGCSGSSMGKSSHMPVYENSIRLYIEPAQGGIVVRATMDGSNGRETANVYVIPDTENIQNRVAEIVTLQLLLK